MVNRSALVLGALIVVSAACKLWMTAGVELGKDEAAYWYWSLHWDLTYAPLPFALLRLAHTLAPGMEWPLRACQIGAGMIAVVLMFHWCRSSKLSEAHCLWASAAFATSHWIWHSSSYLHPDGYLVPLWLLVLVLARRTADRDWRPGLCMGVGVAASATLYCKYSGVLLSASLFVWMWIAAPTALRKRALAYGFSAFAVCASPLVLSHWVDGFHLPRALSSLSRIAAETSVVTRGGLFAAAPLLFVSPPLLWLLYKALASTIADAGRTLARTAPLARPDWMRAHGQLLVALLPACVVVLCFGFFALYRGQVKGNWILPGFLALWPYAFSPGTVRSATRSHSTRFLMLVIVVGLMQTTAVGLALKYPGAPDHLVRVLGGQELINESYPRLVSPTDRAREPTRSWGERLCEYAGWRGFTDDLEKTMTRAGVPVSVALVSTQYNLPFTTAFYASTEAQRAVYTVADPRFMRLADLSTAQPRPDTLLFVARSGSPFPPDLADFATSHQLPPVLRSASGCAAVGYDVSLLVRDGAGDR